MIKKELTVAESPKNAGARHHGSTCRVDIHIAVAHINGLVVTDAEQSQRLVDGIWCRLLPYGGTLPYSDIDIL